MSERVKAEIRLQAGLYALKLAREHGLVHVATLRRVVKYIHMAINARAGVV